MVISEKKAIVVKQTMQSLFALIENVQAFSNYYAVPMREILAKLSMDDLRGLEGLFDSMRLSRREGRNAA